MTPEPIDSEESFLSRWSRRKLGEMEPAEQVLPDEAAPEPDAEANAPPIESAQPTLPAIETLDADSDYSDYLSPKVSADIRKLALRKLFRSAKFNVTDGLDDYDDDFRTFEVLGDVLTADMRHRLEREAEKARASLVHEESDHSGSESPTPVPETGRDAPSERVAAASGNGKPAESEDDSDRSDSQT